MSPRLSSPPLPKGWPKHVKAGFVHAVSLAHRALTTSRGWCADSPLARVRLIAKAEQARSDNAMLREELRIKDTRMARIAPKRRPHYEPKDRLAVLGVCR